MSTNDSSDTHNQIEPFPTDDEARDDEAAATAMGLSMLCAFKIGDNVFRYRGIYSGEAAVDRLSELNLNSSERISMTELWEASQRGNLEIGEWRCQFVSGDESSGSE